MMVLTEAQCIVLKAWMALLLADLSFLYSARGEVWSRRGVSPGVSVLSTSWGLMNAGCSCVESSTVGSTADASCAGVRMMVICGDCLDDQRLWL